MSITLNQLAYQIREELSNGRPSQDSPYKIPYIVLKIREAMNTVLYMQINKGHMNHIPGSAIATYKDVQVQTEESSERDYVLLPDFYLSLPWNKGVHAIADMKEPLISFIRFNNPHVHAHLNTIYLEGDNHGYYVEDDRIYFVDELKDTVEKVLIKLVVSAPDKYGLDDVLPLGPENIIEVQQLVKNTIVNQGVQDKLNDNNKDLVNVPRN